MGQQEFSIQGKRNFGIGIYRPRFKENVGILWRSAYLMGASWIFTIEGPKRIRTKTDTQNTWKQIPLFNFNNMGDLLAVQDVEIVGCETQDTYQNALDLPYFKHPKIAAYLLGNETEGIPKDIMNYCNQIVAIPGVRAQSYNVAMAGTIIMYDRMYKKYFKNPDV